MLPFPTDELSRWLPGSAAVTGSCVEGGDEVSPNWRYVNGEFLPPTPVTEPACEPKQAKLLARVALLEEIIKESVAGAYERIESAKAAEGGLS